VRKGALALKEQAEEIRSAALPIIHSTEQLCLRLGPKIEATLDRVEITVEDLSDITRSLRNQTMEVQALTQEITGRVRRQSQRIDGIFSNALDVVEQAGGFVANVVRQVTGVVASVKAIVDSLRASEARPRHNHSPRS
jgi:methyl-accepting chemotaxis protein